MTLLLPQAFDAPRAEGLTPLGRQLVLAHDLDPLAMADAQDRATRAGVPLDEIVIVRFGLSRRAIAMAHAIVAGTRFVDPFQQPADPQLVGHIGPDRALSMGVLPWRRMGGCTVVLVDHPDVFHRQKDTLIALLGPVRMAFTTRDQLQSAVSRGFGASLVARAETRVAPRESSRHWNARTAMRVGMTALALLSVAAIIAPVLALALLTAISVTLLFLSSALRLAALIMGRTQPEQPDNVHLARLPTITLLIPLFRERAIADHLIARLQDIDYPRELLDVCLVLEASDTTTRDALGQANLLTWMRPVIVPDGTIRTKPRALNYALDFARGSIIGVYDAEDAPAPDQLRVVAAHFAAADRRVACLQGTLDYYNPRANWLTRCFTLEYAAWFRVVLPGLARMGLVVPLGGTTLFFRRDVLEGLGGWDAHNVTEDADLGVRLARHGYRTEFVQTVTEEEANGRAWPWVKQRSRWLKGYAITYGVHMRRPLRLWRDLGPWRFFGVQVLFLGTLAQFVLAPVLWSFWLALTPVGHPLAAHLPAPVFWGMVGLFIATEVLHLTISTIAARRAGKGWLAPWALTMQLYFPLAVMAVYKGLLELAWRPFFWDKTAHGVLMDDRALSPPPPRHPVSDG